MKEKIKELKNQAEELENTLICGLFSMPECAEYLDPNLYKNKQQLKDIIDYLGKNKVDSVNLIMKYYDYYINISQKTDISSGMFSSIQFNSIQERLKKTNEIIEVIHHSYDIAKNGINIDNLNAMKKVFENIDNSSELVNYTFEGNKNDFINDIIKKSREYKPKEFQFRLLPFLNHYEFRKKDLVGIAGSFKSTKTTYSLNLALDIAETKKVGIISLEMSWEELFEFGTAVETGINRRKLSRKRNLTQFDIDALHRYQIRAKRQIFINDNIYTEFEIEQQIKQWSKNGTDAVVIDYLGLIDTNSTKQRWEAINNLSRKLKQFAKKYNVLLIVIAQLNRGDDAKAENLAEGLGLARDCNYLFTTEWLGDKLELNEKERAKYNIPGDVVMTDINEYKYIYRIKLDRARSEGAGHKIYVKLNASGTLKVIKETDEPEILEGEARITIKPQRSFHDTEAM